MNREMLKECIADAKTIRETAIASAKLALEEAFTPQLTAMFAERLNELEEEVGMDKKSENEMYSSVEEEIDETFSLEELLAELSMEENEEPMEKEGKLDGEQVEENLVLEDMSDEEIEELVMQVIDDMIKSGKLMPGEGEEEGEEDMEDMDDMDMDDMDGEDEEEDEDINLEELLAEISEEKVEEAEMVVGDIGTKTAAGAIAITGGLILLAYRLAAAKDKAEREAILADMKKKQDELTSNIATQAKSSVNVTADQAAAAVEKGKEVMNTVASKIKSLAGGSTNEATNVEMEETINELRNELNEVNLLNAKLLYTNKIFKTKNLTESEKIKVLNTFDKAENVKEVKLVFETLNESFKTTTVKKNPIRESLGSASKTISTATPKQPIIESNEAFARMQRLAGLRK